MRLVSLFSGIGGLELGFESYGHSVDLICEIKPEAREILTRAFPGIPYVSDVRHLRDLPKTDLVVAGFPCQDLSQAGAKRGLRGSESVLVAELFRLIRRSKPRPRWLVLENVPYMLRLHRGQFMTHLTDELEALGYSWCYRTVDARAFGLPQRRPRVLIVAGLKDDPRRVLLRGNVTTLADTRPTDIDTQRAYGFYWTEGSRGVGWVMDAVPPIKGGSGLGIPSPPAVWIPKRDFVGTLDLRDAERLQGFPEDWTLPAGPKRGPRWQLVGNAVCVPVASWLAKQFNESSDDDSREAYPMRGPWPAAAYGFRGKRFEVRVSPRPVENRVIPIRSFLRHSLRPLSQRATLGFLARASVCTNVVYSQNFIASLKRHAKRQQVVA